MKRDRKKRKVDRSACLADLPSHILMEVISRLPIKSVIAIACVAKSLLSIVSDSDFKGLYSTRAPTELFFGKRDSPIVFIADSSSSSTAVDIKYNTVFELPKFSVKPNNTLNFRVTTGSTVCVSSCNGLLCYGGHRNGFAAICNPITGEYVTIPGPDWKDTTIVRKGTQYELGFSPKHNRFKLLRMVPRREVVAMIVDMYTFDETGSWKPVADCPKSFGYWRRSTFYQGARHWFSRKSFYIHTFDFDTDQFGKISPPHFPYIRDYNEFEFEIGVFGDCLCLTVDVGRTSDCTQVWVMKEYGVQTSWIKAFSFSKEDEEFSPFYEPIFYLQNKEILMVRNARYMVCYNPDTSSIKSIASTWIIGNPLCRPISMRPTLVSLKVLLGDNVTTHDAKSWGAHEKFKVAENRSLQKNSAQSLGTQQKFRGKSVASSSTCSAQTIKQQIEQMRAEIEECARRDHEERARRDQEFDRRDAERQRQIQQLTELLKRSQDTG